MVVKWFKIEGCEWLPSGLEFRAVSGLGFMVWGLGLRVWGLGFRV